MDYCFRSDLCDALNVCVINDTEKGVVMNEFGYREN